MSEYRRAKATDSSFHRYVERGLLAADRGGDARDIQGSLGEWNGGQGRDAPLPTLQSGAARNGRQESAAPQPLLAFFHQVICPTGSCREFLSSPSAKNISLFQKPKSVVMFAPSRTREEGRIAIVTDVGSGMRWTRRCR